MNSPIWWKKPRNVSILVDNDSWILPWARKLGSELTEKGDNVCICRDPDEILQKGVAFYLGCVNLVSSEILARNHRNLVVHESDLPEGKGFAPMTWQILEDKHTIPVCLLEAVEKVDAGNIIYRENLKFKGHELIDEMRWAQGQITTELCLRFMDEKVPPEGIPQTGIESFYPRRTPEDSELNVHQTIAVQFNKLRVADNKRYPTFFYHQGHCYKLAITKQQID